MTEKNRYLGLTIHIGPVTVQFIVSTTLDKTDADTRKLIRSHVMRGKNTGKTRPRKAVKRANVLSPPDAGSPASEVRTEAAQQSTWVAARPCMVATDLDLFDITSGLPASLKDLISKGMSHSALPTLSKPY